MNLNFGDYGQPNPMSGQMAYFGQVGGGAPAAPGGGGQVPIAASAPGMNFGTPLSSNSTGFMPPTGAGATPGATAPGGKFGNFMGGFANLAEGLSGLGQLYIGLKSLGLAKEQLAFSKEAYAKNMGNTTKSYNTALEDRLRSRGVTEGRSQEFTDSEIAKNRL
jgi:hypothetical protein